MRREKYYPYFFLIAVLLFFLSLPLNLTQGLRSFAICSISPTWSGLLFLKEKSLFLLTLPVTKERHSQNFFKEYEELRRENQLLCVQLENMRQWLLNEDRIEEQLARLKSLQVQDTEGEWRDFFKRRYEQVAQILSLQFKALPAKVVFREPSSWSSYIWLDVGERQNRSLKQAIIAKNSPVVIGNALIGVVEEVKEAQCKVRLITDANLIPAVRSVRGWLQDRFLNEQIESIFQIFQVRRDLFDSPIEEREFFLFLQKLQKKLNQKEIDLHLAKGELHGNSQPLWRARGQVLKGYGFNYDFHDEEGPARDLRTGELIGEKNSRQAIPLLKEGDLLVTSGLDGIFPIGLEVGIVTKVECLKEGACAYEIEAKTVAGNFDELSTVFVLPPLAFERPH
jgi:rod shape-determining protein MreC